MYANNPVTTEATKRATEAKRTADTQTKLNVTLGRFSGPYKVDGATVSATPMFRMNGDPIPKSDTPNTSTEELVKICTKTNKNHVPANELTSAVTNARMGRPTPKQLVLVTQALIDAGKLPPPKSANDTVDMRIRQMQRNWGIGVDCAGYVREGAVAVHGDGAQPLVKGTNRSGAIHDILQTPAFKKVAFKEDVSKEGADPKVHNFHDIRAGDIIHLDSKKSNAVGHNAIVYSHEVATDAMRDELWNRAARTTHVCDVNGFFRSKGPFHVLNVDSSWGVDLAGVAHGGFRRDTWIYDESTGMWGTFLPGTPFFPNTEAFITDQEGPYNHKFKDAFRPASAK